MLDLNPTEPPWPTDPVEKARWEHTRLRRRILQGQWRQDLLDRVLREFSEIRAEAIGDPDMSSNVLAQTSQQLASLYDRDHFVRHPDNQAAAAELQRQLRLAQHGPMMQRVQRDTIGLREMLVRIDVVGTGKDARVAFRPVSPDFVIATPDPYNPSRPIRVCEARLRCIPGTGLQEWTWDDVDWSVPASPSYRVLSADMKTDLSGRYLKVPGGLRGSQYPALDEKGHGLPLYVVYHAAVTAQLWDAFHGVELVEGTLECGVLWTMFGHGVRNASWPQRYTLDADVVGASGEDDNQDGAARDVVDADPTSVVKLFSTNEQKQAVIGQWLAGCDPDKLITAVSQYERRVSTFAGIDDPAAIRMSGDPRSGYALMISRDGKREAARKFEPSFRVADEQLLAICAALLNRAGGFRLPTTGYLIEYQGIPPSQDELDTQQKRLVDLVDRGWMDEASAVAELFGISVVEAQRRLDENAKRKAARAALATPPAATDVAAPAPAQVAASPDAAAPPEGVAPDGAPVIAPTAALNGAQVESALAICDQVARRTMPRPDGVARLRLAFAMSAQMAEDFMGETGRTFFLDEPPDTAADVAVDAAPNPSDASTSDT